METIEEHQLRDQIDQILHQVAAGAQFTVTKDGRPVAHLGPPQKRFWVPKAEFLQILRSLPPDPTLMDDVADMGGRIGDLEDCWKR